MNRRNVLTLCVIAASGIVLLPSAAVGQQKSLKEQLVGAWTLVSAVDILPDGSKSEPWGPIRRAHTCSMPMAALLRC